MLSGLLLIPFLGALALVLWPGDPAPDKVRRASVFLLGLQLFWTLWLLIPFDPGNPELQLHESLPWVDSLGLDYRLGIDGLSMPLVIINAALTMMSAWTSHATSSESWCLREPCSSL